MLKRRSQQMMQTDARRRMLVKGAAVLPTLSTSSLFAQTSLRPLPIPTQLDATDSNRGRTELHLLEGRHDFGSGALSDTIGINQNYLGPVVRVRKGMPFSVDVHNTLKESVACHWHGLHIEGQYDGGPHQEVAPDDTWSPNVPIEQRAGMSWFHSHTHGSTARQVYQGMTGVMLIEDDDSLAADIPKTYGVDDFVVVLQDKLFSAGGQISYPISEQTAEDGFQGNTVVINGTIAPAVQDVPKGIVRLRILNACNARFLTLSLSDGLLNVIASDGGFLAKTVQTENLVMSPGERYEVLVDMRSIATLSVHVSFDNDDFGIGGWVNRLLGRTTAPVALTLNTNQDKGMDSAIPHALANIEVADRSASTVTRSFNLTMGSGEGGAGSNQLALAMSWGNVCGTPQMGMGINGAPMKMDTINEKCAIGQTELWRISADEQRHPFHIHGCSFRILSQENASPPDYAMGWKDMVIVQDGWSEVLVRFDHTATKDTPYMYHCHILEHEDCGMMGQFTVT